MARTGGGATRAFALDRFQVEALEGIDAGEHVLVAAPTGAGKTVVAEHAVAGALAAGRRAFYTTPIKALSNQKYADLVRAHGSQNVGLLTGDNAINPDAAVVVMTTEVLRNMVYARAAALENLAWVILDEVHYLQDTYRGPVWEEVVVHTPPEVRFVCLSATVSNAEELAGWIEAVRGPTRLIVEHERPVELHHQYLVFDREASALVQVPTLVGGRANPEGDRFDAPAFDGPRHLRYRQRGRQRWGTPRRTEVVSHLAGADLLPAIVFIFSRAACDDAARDVLDAGFRLASGPERERIRAIVAEHVAHLSDEDLAILGYDRWLAGLEAGVAAHHAGMVPPFKEAVEACFVEGLVKVVFATETLALGINMPARSVVIETLSKFTGEHHEDLTPSQFTQLTGRAGRRGLDPVGHAVVLWSPWYGFDKVAALASSREYVLRSAFRPTYNMVVNLAQRHTRDEAHELLGRSFAQYQADRSLARLANRRSRRDSLLTEARAAAVCERGDVDEYIAARRAERQARRDAKAARRDGIASALDHLGPGDVIRLGGARLAVLSVATRKGGIRLQVVDTEVHTAVLDSEDFDEPPVRLASITLPEPYNPRNRIFQRRTAGLLRKAKLRHYPAATDAAGVDSSGELSGYEATLASDLAVAGCPDIDRHVEAAVERDRLVQQIADLDQRIGERESSLVRRFERISTVLEEWGFLDGWTVTDRGAVLARIFHESDLLCAVAVCDGVFDDLDPAELAGLASLLTYEHRSREAPPPPWYPSRRVRERAQRVDQLARRISRDEDAAGLPETRLPEHSFLALAHAWAAGESLDVVIADEDLTGGDFVRNVKTLIDLLRQIGEVAPLATTARSARAAADALHRGIVAVSSEVHSQVDGDGEAADPGNVQGASDPGPPR